MHRSAHAALQCARKRCQLTKKAAQHHRDNFPALSAGISFGGGQKVRSAAFFVNNRLERRSLQASKEPGWCCITALGDFDPTKGGHLVLWDLKLVIEFPPGSTVLLPSAAIAHSNTAIDCREMRCSFTQFTAGGLFRWTSHRLFSQDDDS